MAAKTKIKVRDPMAQLELREVDRKRYQEWAEARGRNETYQPFIRARSTHSLGRKHYFFCPILKRHVRLLSDGELLAYKYLIWQPRVINIEEQYALNPITTFDIATEMKVVHPYSYKLHIHHVMSTDFLVTSLNEQGIPIKIAYSYKPKFDPYIPSRTHQKLAIEGRCWSFSNIKYRVLTSKHITKSWYMTLRFCELHYDENLPLKSLMQFSQELEFVHKQQPWQPLRSLLLRLSKMLTFSLRDSERYFKNAVLSGFISPDRNLPVLLNKPLVLRNQPLLNIEDLPYAV
jgi:hypothetical protein